MGRTYYTEIAQIKKNILFCAISCNLLYIKSYL